MTRKDYVAIARALRYCEIELHEDAAGTMTPEERKGAALACAVIADEIAHVLKMDNPRFDRGRFMEAARRP